MSRLFVAIGILCFLVFLATAAYGQTTATLTIRSQYGSPDPSVGTHTYTLNTWSTASVVTPVAGSSGIRYLCTGWRARGSPDTLPAEGTGNSITFQITMNTTLTWRWKTQYQLTTTASPGSGGTINVSPTSSGGWYDAKSTVALTATGDSGNGNEGYDFSYWTGGLRGTGNPQNLLLRGPRTVTANFIREKRYFTVSGYRPPPLDPPPAPWEYYYGDTVTADCGTTPYPLGEGMQEVCTGHLGTGDVTDGPETSISFIIYHDSSVSWLWQTQYKLTTAANPPGYGTVAPSGETWHNAGAVVSVTATGILPYGFTNWSGDLTGSENPKNITMNGAKSVTANFSTSVSLTVSNPQGYDTPVPAVGTYTYTPSESVTCSVTSPLRIISYYGPALTYNVTIDGPWSGAWNMGFRFTANKNITITKVSTNKGTGTVPVTIWTDAGTLLKQVDVPGCVEGVWTEADVDPPLALTAGQTYRIAAQYGGPDGYYYQTDVMPAAASDITALGYCYGSGTAPVFPSAYGSGYVFGLANFKYEVSESRYYCTGYTGTGDLASGGSTSSVTFPITQASTITWNWALQHQLATTISPAGTGTIETSPASTGGYFNDGTVVTLTAVPSAAYILKNWSEDLTGSEISKDLTMNAPKRVTATFEKPTLTVSSAYDTPSPGVGTWTYDRGTSITCSVTSPSYSADGNSRYTCTGYTGTGSCPSGSGTTTGPFTITTYSTITWNWISHYKLVITAVNPLDWGTVTKSPDLEWYDSGTVVTVTAAATPAETRKFLNWSGAWTGSENPVNVTMDTGKSVTANFGATVTVASPIGAPNPSVGTHDYPGATPVTVSCGTNPYAGGAGIQYVCTGWTGGSGDIPTTGTAASYGPFSISGNCTITWTWKTQYYLTISVLPIFPVVGGTALPTSNWYDANTGVAETATFSTGFTFTNWTGDVSSTDNPLTVTMDVPKSITANFTEINPHTVTVASPYGVPNPPVGTHTYPDSYSATLSCGTNPYPDGTGIQRVCTGYTGTGNLASGGSTSSVTFIITQNSSVTWTWKTQYQLTTAVNPAGSGSVTPESGSWHDAGTALSCAATATGWGFVNWSGDLSGTENPKDLTMDSLKSIIANFFQPTLTVYNPTGHDSPKPFVGTHTLNYDSTVTCSVASPEFEPVSGTFTDDFEAGVSQWWSPGGGVWGNAGYNRHSEWYSALLGAVADDHYSYMERTFIIAEGGGTVAFWWKVSSESGGDYLRFYIDGSEQVAISGTVGWESRSYSLAAGARRLRWAYTKNASGSAGSDCGWIDDVEVTNTTTGTFTEPFNAMGLPGWTVDGTGPEWLITSAQHHSGTYSLQSAAIGHCPDYYIRSEAARTRTYTQRKFTIGEGGGQVSFWWKVSCEPPYSETICYDYLEFSIDGVCQARIAGEVGWQLKQYPLTAGQHTLRWLYAKDISDSSGSDCGWVDDIEVTNTGYPGVNYVCTGYTGTGGCPSGSGSTTGPFTITSYSSITWNWKIVYLLAVSVNPAGGGTVDISPPSSVGYGYYDVDAPVTLTASPSAGYLFGNWTGDLSSNTSSETITMTGPKYVTANFTGQNKPSDFVGTVDNTSAITWSWTTSNTDWQSIAAGVLRTVLAATLTPPLPESETCPRDGSRVLFGTIDVSGANTYTITYTKLSDTTWTCTADTNLAVLKDFYIDQTGALKEALSTGDGPQAGSGSPTSPNDVWWEIHKVDPVGSSATVWPNITSYQETGLSENTQYTRHVHAVNGAVYSVASYDASKYTFIHDATPSDFELSIGTSTKTKLVGERTGPSAQRYPIDIAYNFARCQMLLYGSEIGQAGTQGKITKIRFQRAAAVGDNSLGDTVNYAEMYMGYSDLAMLPATWTDTAGHQLVYSGDLTIPSGAASTWYEIALTNPFLYDGTRNIIISFTHHDGSAEVAYTTWLTSSASRTWNYNTLGGRCIAFYDNTQNPPNVPAYQEYTFFPNIQLDIEMSMVTITVTAPPNSTSISTGVKVERATDSDFTDMTVIQPYLPATYTVTDIPPVSGVYWYRIGFQNGDGIPSAYSEGKDANIP